MQHLHFYVNYYQNDWSELLSIMNFAAVTLSHESTNLFFFKMKLDYESWISFDWESHMRSSTAKKQLNRNQAQWMIIWMQEIWNFAQAFMKRIQIKQKKQADKHWWKIDFSIENEVWISIKNWKTDWFSKKLDSQTADFYRITKKIKYSYQINFSDSIKMHSVFSSDKLWKTARNSLTE